METLIDALRGLPPVPGMIVTGLFPIVTIGSGLATLLAIRRRRRGLAVVCGTMAALGLLWWIAAWMMFERG